MKREISIALTISVILSIFSGCSLETKITKTTEYNEGNIGEVYCSPIDSEHIVEYDNGIMYADNEILLVAEDGTSYATVENLAKEYNAEIVGWIEQTGDYQLKFSTTYTKDEIDNIASKIESKSYIESAYVNYISEVSTDSINYGSEWSGENWSEEEHSGSNWNLEAIHCLSAWELFEKNTTEKDAIKVGLIDSGFDDNHEDLGFVETFYNNDYMQYYNSINTAKEKLEASHGTHVAGIMAAKSNNNEGICGVYSYGDNNLYGVALRGTNGVSSYKENCVSSMYLKIALSELILRNVKVINISWGVEANLITLNNQQKELKEMSNMMSDFLNKLLNKNYDFVIVVSAGNESNNYYAQLNIDNSQKPIYDSNGKYYQVVCKGTSWYYNDKKIKGLSKKNIKYIQQADATYNSELCCIDDKELKDRIIVVGSICENSTSKKKEYPNILYDGTLNVGFGDPGYKISNFSNLGNRVDVLAPGGGNIHGVYSTFPNNKYYGYNECYCGTSMAAPHVAGVAAMVWTVNNNLKGDEVKKIICNTSNELFSMGVIGDEVIRSGYKLVNAHSAILEALGKEVTDTHEYTNTSKNGGILSWVVDIDDNNKFIPEAKIIATNVSTGTIEAETTTDLEGHFELILPEGKYILTVEAPEYETYNSKEIEVKNESINYLDDWIKLKSKKDLTESGTHTEVTQIVNLEEENNKCGDNATWHFDETNGTLTISGTGDMYDYDGIHFSRDNLSAPWSMVIDNISDITSIIIEDGITSIGECAFYDLPYIQFVKLPNTLKSIGKEAFRSFNYSDCNNMFKTITIPKSVTYIGENALGYYDTSYNDENGDVQYASLLYGLTIRGYTGSTAETYAKENGITFVALDNQNSNEVELENQVNYKEIYINIIEELSGYSNKTSINYTLFDMNNDSIPELVTISGTCEADYILTFYSIIDGVAVIVGDGFSGFHASFYIDIDKNQFCTHWGQNGVGGIEWYSFDGKTVTLSKSQENIDYGSNEYSNDDYSNYGNFIQCDMEMLWCSFLDNTWTSWLYTYNNPSYIEYQGKDYSLIYNYNN